MKTWNKINPPLIGDYICRMDNAYIKICHWDGKKWYDMWQTNIDGTVIEWMNIPYDKENER